jgi:serine/threonine-protein phosphatase PGAM5
MVTRTLYLVRHGHHDLTSTHRLGGSLTPIGVEQAQLTAERLGAFPITAIYCSTLPRATETAEIIAQKFPDVRFRRSRRLWECIPCIPPAWAEYSIGHLSARIAQDKKQAEDAFDTYFRPARGKDKHEIVVSHGNLIRYFICRALQVQPEGWGNMDLCNCGISEILIRPEGRMTLMSHNDICHLPDRLVTSLVGPKLAKTLYNLAQIALDQGDLVQARQWGRESLAILQRGQYKDAAQVSAWLNQLPPEE